MERTGSNESIHLRGAGREHCYLGESSITAAPRGVAPPMADLLDLAGADITLDLEQACALACGPGDDILALILKGHDPLWDTAAAALPPQDDDVVTTPEADLAAMAAQEQALLFADGDPFLGCPDFNQQPQQQLHNDIPFDIDLFAGTSKAVAAMPAIGSEPRGTTERQYRLFEDWLEKVNAAPLSTLTPGAAVSADAATAAVSVATGCVAAAATGLAPLGGWVVPPSSPPLSTTSSSPPSSPALSSDAGYETTTAALSPHSVTSSSSSSLEAMDFSSPVSMTDNLVRGGQNAARVLGAAVLQTPAVTPRGPVTVATTTVAETTEEMMTEEELASLEEKEREKMSGPTAFSSESSMFWNPAMKFLTDEEKEVLEAEGLPVPQSRPFSSADVKAIKVVRRKIKNKLSAFESRRKKKHYISGLEKRVKTCSSENKQLQKRVEQLEAQNSSLAKQLSNFRDQLSTGLMSTLKHKATPGQFGLLLFALCFVVMLPSMPSGSMVPLFSARTQMAVSQMPTSSPAATAFDYRLKKHISRTLLGYSLPTSQPDLEDTTAPVHDDSSTHYVSEAAMKQRINSSGPLMAASSVNFMAGRLMIERVKHALQPVHVLA